MKRKLFAILLMLIAPFFVGVGMAQADGENVSVTYQTHVQKVGWQDWRDQGEMAGTTGMALRLEGIRIRLNMQGYTGGVKYQTHVQSYGWQEYKRDGEMSGTSGEAKRLEAIRISLYGEVADNYNICYRVHAQHFGWLDWACNGDSAGTATYAYRLEGIEIRMLKKTDGDPSNILGTNNPYETRRVFYRTHVQSDGWQDWQADGAMAGTSGRALRLEGINIKLGDIYPFIGGITYRTHIQKVGWQEWKSDGDMAGTSGMGLRLEGIEIKLTGILAQIYDVEYRTHVQSYGWQEWKKNGEMSGTSGEAKRLEGIEIRLVPKVSGVGYIDQGGQNPQNPVEPPEEDEDPTSVRTPLVYAQSPSRSYYDQGLNVKFESTNYYVDGFEAQASEDQTFSNCVYAYTCNINNTMMTYNRYRVSDDLGETSFNDVNYDVVLNKNDGVAKQYVRVRAYRQVEGVTYYSEYSDPVEVQYNKLNVDLAGGQAMNVWTADQLGGILIGPESQYYTYRINYRLVTPTRAGYRFVGWTGSNGNVPQTEVLIPSTTTGELNYTANWQELTEADYVTLPVPKVVKNAPKNYNSRESSDFSLNIYYEDTDYYVNSFEIYASNTEDGEYTIVNPMDYNYNSAYYDQESGRVKTNNYDANVVVTNDSFVKYYKVRAHNNGQDYDRYSPFSEPIRVEMGMVVLNLGYGSMPTYLTADNTPQITYSNQMYVYGQEYKLVNPIMKGNTFVGWIGSNGDVPSKDVTIPADSEGILSYTAVWSSGAEPVAVPKPKLIVDDTYNYPTLKMWVGYESYADWADGFQLYYATEENGDYQPYDFPNGCSNPMWYGARYGSINTYCNIGFGVDSDLYLKVVAYKINGENTIYSELSDETAYMHVQPIHFILNGGHIPDGGWGTAEEEDPLVYLIPTVTAYEPGFRYSIIAPVRDGYTFAGWTGSNGSVPQIDFIIGKDVDMPLEYSANWIKN